MAQLKDKTKQDIHLSLLFQYPTVRQLAQHLEDLLDTHPVAADAVNKPPTSPIVRLAEGAHEVPLFLVHPVGGSVFWYQHLARELHGHLSVFGVEDPSINDPKLTFATLEEMAAYYAESIIHYYPGKRIYLGGASFGANLAYAMVELMNARGISIEFLGLFDGWLHYPAQLMQHNALDAPSTPVAEALQDEYQRLSILEDYRRDLLLEYQPTRIKTDAILFKACELWPQFAAVDAFDNGWKQVIDGALEVHHVPGTHESMLFSPHVTHLAALVKKLVWKD